MHPVLFTIGNFPIGTYGVLVALSALAALGLVKILAQRADLDPDRLVDLFVYALLAGFVTAKAALILGDFRAFLAAPLHFLAENLRSFGAFYGGFLGAVLVAAVYLKKHKLPFWKTADVAAPCLALAQSMGRWGCFFAGCCYGKPTDLPWGMVFPAVPACAGGTPIHPWPLYESAVDLLLFVVLMALFRRRRFDGQVFLLYIGGYAVARGLLEFLRGDSLRGLFFGGAVSLSQVAAAAALLSSGILYWFKRRRASLG